MNFSSVKVFQVLTNGAALANTKEKGDYSYYSGPVVLIMSNETTFYDDQVVQLKSNEHFVRVGEYRYRSGGGMNKTVPAITIKSK